MDPAEKEAEAVAPVEALDCGIYSYVVRVCPLLLVPVPYDTIANRVCANWTWNCWPTTTTKPMSRDEAVWDTVHLLAGGVSILQWT